MKYIYRNMKDKAGYISIETITIVGLMICLGIYIIYKLFGVSSIVSDNANDRITEVLEVVSPIN
ncbi:MAG: hypothetical protein K0R54_670 [Clostridiaceae bacterium]|jgi:hypothetical protein|nr:hypothetical protein [Clostridiaceae bacterium]